MKFTSIIFIAFSTILAQNFRGIEDSCRNSCSVLQDSGLIGNCVVQCIQIVRFNNPTTPSDSSFNNGQNVPLQPTEQKQGSPTQVTQSIEIVTTTLSLSANPSPSSNPSSSSAPQEPKPIAFPVTPVSETESSTHNDNSRNNSQSYPTLNNSASYDKSPKETSTTTARVPANTSKRSSTVPTTIYSFSHSSASILSKPDMVLLTFVILNILSITY